MKRMPNVTMHLGLRVKARSQSLDDTNKAIVEVSLINGEDSLKIIDTKLRFACSIPVIRNARISPINATTSEDKETVIVWRSCDVHFVGEEKSLELLEITCRNFVGLRQDLDRENCEIQWDLWADDLHQEGKVCLAELIRESIEGPGPRRPAPQWR